MIKNITKDNKLYKKTNLKKYMLDKKELKDIALAILVISVSIGFGSELIGDWEKFFQIFLAVTLVISLNILAKKFMAYNLDAKTESKIWELKMPRAFENLRNVKSEKRKQKGDKFAAGIILPIISRIILFPLGSFIWMGALVFDVTPRIYRGAKRFGLYTFSDITEGHIGIIAAAGVLFNLILSISGYLLGFTLFARLNLYYAFFNILPLSELDGNKIFFGNKIIWSILASIVLIGMFFSIFMI